MIIANVFDFDETLYGTKANTLAAYSKAYKDLFKNEIPESLLESIWNNGVDESAHILFSKEDEIGGNMLVYHCLKKLKEAKNFIYKEMLKSNPPELYKRVCILSSNANLNYICTKASEESFKAVTELIPLPFKPTYIFFKGSKIGKSEQLQGAFRDLEYNSRGKDCEVNIIDDSEKELFNSVMIMRKEMSNNSKFFLTLVESGYPRIICHGRIVCN